MNEGKVLAPNPCSENLSPPAKKHIPRTNTEGQLEAIGAKMLTTPTQVAENGTNHYEKISSALGRTCTQTRRNDVREDCTIDSSHFVSAIICGHVGHCQRRNR
jgi:hypothetical protein